MKLKNNIEHVTRSYELVVTDFMRYLFSQHFDIMISRNQKSGEVGIGRSGTVAATGLLVANQVQILTFTTCEHILDHNSYL